MRSKNLRALVSLFVAMVFAAAAMPGSMAMPAPRLAPSLPANMAMADMPGCDQAAPAKVPADQGKPCKGMVVCLGVLGCFGVAAVPSLEVVVLNTPKEVAPPLAVQTSSGLSIPPDSRPPIAG